MQALCGNHKYIRPGGGARTHGLLPQTERHSHWSSKANNSRSSKPTPLSIRPHSHTKNGRMEKISYQDRKTNEDVLTAVGEKKFVGDNQEEKEQLDWTCVEK